MARSFNGTTDYIQVPDAVLLRAQSPPSLMSVACRVLFNVNNVRQDFFNAWTNIPATHFSWLVSLIGGGPTIGFYISDNGSNAHLCDSGVTPSTNTWYDIVATFDGSNQRIYINAVLKTNVASGFGSINSSDHGIVIGCGAENPTAQTYFLNGMLSDCAIWNGVILSQSEIAAFSNGISPLQLRPNAAPIGYWPLNDAGTTTTMYSPLGSPRTATVVGTKQAKPSPKSNKFYSPFRNLLFSSSLVSTAISIGIQPAYIFRPGLGPSKGLFTPLAYTTPGIINTLSAAQGTYTLTGKAQAVNFAKSISAAQGTYTLTGEAVTLKVGKGLSAVSGTYTLTGEPQSFIKTLGMPAIQGSYTLSGQSQFFAIVMPVSSGSYSLVGQAQSFLKTLSIVASQGTYTLTGNAQVLSLHRAGAVSISYGHRWMADMGQMSEQNF